ncbi:PBECR4 domain-containing protein [Streptococcus pasteurianus]|uniref:PBECR4 domain-containing protein n=1 Tax=Streptococcus pasteurianus TaxID=197614 RepID=UPI0022E20CC3|nr:PBECR4 domain-containing protein [Streptococcus pasteurianus]
MALTKAQAKSLSILDVARSLGMEMRRSSHKEYYWKEHDSFKIDTTKNTWNWYSRGIYGDTIDLVQEMRQITYGQAIAFLDHGDYPEAKKQENVRQPFKYTLSPYEEPFNEARDYLKMVRGLSDETIDFFFNRGMLAQARRQTKDGYAESVLVFKSYSRDGEIVGASLQGLTPNKDRYEGKGYLKQIMYQSEGISGLNVAIGSPKRLVVAEAPIDLMSYYELYKETLEDVRLVAMDGLKEGLISHYAMELLQDLGEIKDETFDYTKSKDLQIASNFLKNAAQQTTLFHNGAYQDLITLAVDNDQAGTDFLESLRDKDIPVIDARPTKEANQEKMDWNEYLQMQKERGRELVTTTEQKEKAPDRSQEPYSNAGDSHRNPDSLGDLSPGAASKPVVDEPQPDFPVIAHLKFTTKDERMSTIKPGYHVITNGELNRLNKFAPGLQATAQWYLRELSGSTISYLYQDGETLGKLSVQFSDENFAHLTGISPKGVEMKQVVYDFAQGVGDYGNIQVSHAIKDKSMVLPLLPDILSSQSFVFNDLSEVEKFNRIDLSQAIKTNDEDLLLAIRDVDGVGIPASVMRMKEKLSESLQGKENIVLAVYRQRDGQLDQLSINEEYVRDGGKRFEDILKNDEFNHYQEEAYREEMEQLSAKRDSDGDGISDEEELKQGTNPYDFRSTPSSKGVDENTLEPEETFLVAGSVAVADIIKNKDITGLNQHLKEGIKAYLNSENYKKFLTKMSQFNQYSSRNLRLILAQKPDASYLAPYNTWKKFDRHVKRGEKALSVIIPVTYVKKDQQGHPILDKDGKPETGLTFRLKPTTFDVSQTEGKAMPKAAEVKEQLTDLDYANLYRALMSIAKTNNVSVRFEEMERSTFGYYNPTENQIVLRSNEMNKSQIIKTFLHETAHSELHHNDNSQQEQLTKSTAELQAESVAYVVASYYGIDTADYSFDYLAGWSNDKETLADLEAQLDIVQQEAKSLMVRMDQELEQLRLVQQRQSQQQFEQKLQKYKDQTKQAVEDHKKEMKEEAQSKKEKGLSK